MAVAQTTEGNAVPAQRPLIMRYAARSDVGRIRSKNDDSAYVGRHLAVVADGMGGHAGGDIASASTVLDMIHLDQDNYDGDAETVLADEIQTANSLLSELVHINPKLAGMGTTVTALLLAEGKLHFAHIGDSRAYRLRGGAGGTFEQISVDHTFVQRLIDEGRLLPEEAESHPHKNVLMRVLGDVDASPELDLATLDVEPGERWLLCSDGLNYVPGNVVEKVVRETLSLRQCANKLVELTLAAGAPDNVTVVVLEINQETHDDVSTDAVDVVALPAAADKITGTKSADEEPDGGTAAKAPAAAKAAAVESPAAAAAASGKADASAQPKAKPTAGAGSDSKAVPSAAGGTPSSKTAALASEAAASSSPATDDLKEPDTTTDPHLGEHLSAEVLREELASRPHELVGAAAEAAETGSIPTVAGRSVARRAATVLTHKAEQDRLAALEAEEGTHPRRRRWITVTFAAVLALFVVAGLWLGYAWTQTRYYIGEYDRRVAIYNGISQRLGPIQLSTLETVTEIRMDSLPEFTQQRVRQTVPASDLYDAQAIVRNLKETGSTTPGECAKPSASASPTASTAPTASPGSTAPSSPGAPSSAAAASPQPTGQGSAAPKTSPTCEVAK
ncbi:PP2C family serine/threonine-protein phosphatase [Arthrobacter sp. M4]|uniref:PP2C family protein-serine/threonine phosphatase n=1 Tax=Arthrobacter sp. M4 TaxID=218160 RepID=UPI001CDC64BA|nr:PP2C family serine/threonine-protein phosphatase [Arthrobacter sp. M4]MCA4133206.1 protein phosphatase 2C domain-containing protein [Arthrobacter sp. M4]